MGGGGAVRLLPDTGSVRILWMHHLLWVLMGFLWLDCYTWNMLVGDMGQCSTLPVQGGYEAKPLSKLKSRTEQSRKASGMYEKDSRFCLSLLVSGTDIKQLFC